MKLVLFSQFTQAQVSINIDGGDIIYIQNFDEVYPAADADRDSGDDIVWTNDVTLVGWYAAQATTPDSSYFTEYRVSEGDETSTPRLYSLGPNKTDSDATDRALGFHTNSTSNDVALAVIFENSGNNPIQSVSLHITGEQWRINGGCSKGRQRIKIGYKVAANMKSILDNASTAIGSAYILNDDFVNIQEAVLVNRDTTSLASALNGNNTANQSVVSLTFPVLIPSGDQFLLRFYDEELSCGNADPPIALDSLKLVFSTSAQETIFDPVVFSDRAGTSNDIAQYLTNGIIKNILENPNDEPEPGYPVYVAPSGAEYTAWQTILTDFYINGNYSNVKTAVAAYDYELISYPKAGDVSNPYRVLRRKSSGANLWGTFVLDTNPDEPHLNLQAPHTVNDSDSGIQAASVLLHTGARSLIFADADRCSNADATGCNGTGKCDDGIGGKYHSTADLAHDSSNLMDLAMRVIAQNDPLSFFIQLHGFSNTGRAFDFVISNGTDINPIPSHRDLALKLANELESITSANIPYKSTAFDARVPHIGETITELRGFTNTQGRYINEIDNGSYDPCTDGNASSANGRFVHLEQHEEIRKLHQHHMLLSQAIANAISSALPVNFISADVQIIERSRVLLSWTVTEEINHSHYEIERSNDGFAYNKIGVVSSSSHENKGELMYCFEDVEPLIGDNFYRIKQVDFDGVFEYLVVKHIHLDHRFQRLEFYPNPSDQFIEFKSTVKGVVEILSLNGMSQIKTKESRVDISGLSSGVYLVILRNEIGKIISQNRLIKTSSR